MTYDRQYLENLLRSARERKLRAKVLEKPDEELDFLYRCLDGLDGDGKKLLTALYIDGGSVRRCAMVTNLSRYYVEREKDRLLGLLSGLFTERFGR
ncbi:MAG: hypothetical protein IJ735_07740 [Clostridia bacterium]|nr:hypothetical protein [Clostridia bacterium]